MSPHFNSLFQEQMKTFMDSPVLGVSDYDLVLLFNGPESSMVDWELPF